MIAKIVNLEANRDAGMIAKQVKSEAEESSETFDALALVINEYFSLKADLVKVEAEVYEFGRIL